LTIYRGFDDVTDCAFLLDIVGFLHFFDLSISSMKMLMTMATLHGIWFEVALIGFRTRGVESELFQLERAAEMPGYLQAGLATF
jgi:hypothetical protein